MKCGVADEGKNEWGGGGESYRTGVRRGSWNDCDRGQKGGGGVGEPNEFEGLSRGGFGERT